MKRWQSQLNKIRNAQVIDLSQPDKNILSHSKKLGDVDLEKEKFEPSHIESIWEVTENNTGMILSHSDMHSNKNNDSVHDNQSWMIDLSKVKSSDDDVNEEEQRIQSQKEIMEASNSYDAPNSERNQSIKITVNTVPYKWIVPGQPMNPETLQ